MNPDKDQWNVVHMSEFKAKKAAKGSPFGPVQKGIVGPSSQTQEDPELRKHIDEAIALANSHLTPKDK